MKNKMNFLVMFFALLFATSALAQTENITGNVIDENGNAAIAATVKVTGTEIGTVTDIDGNFNLEVPTNAETLTISYIGKDPIVVPISNNMTISLTQADNALDEVVVTALGIETDKRSLGYATEQVSGEEVSQVKDANFVNSLSGKVSGLNIGQGNSMGSSSNVFIRGQASLLGNNQALFVVDGVPISNRQNNRNTTGGGGFDYGNAAMDINPNDIASISVLKGAAASALYGSRATNGVILITTKKGKKRNGVGVTITQGLTTGSIDKSTFVKYQNQYGQGYFFADDFPEFDFGNGNVANSARVFDDASFGPEFDPNIQVADWRSYYTELDTYGQTFPYVAAQNTPVEFFENSFTNNTNISLDGGSETSTYRLGYTFYDQNGILPNSEMSRHNATFSATNDFTKQLKFSVNANYNYNEAVGRYGTGYDNRNPMQSFRQWYGRNVDVKQQEAAYLATGQNLSWNAQGPNDPAIAGTPYFFDNYYFNRYENTQNDDRSRLNGKVQMDYEINDWLSITGRVGLDTYNELREERVDVRSVDVGDYTRQNGVYSETNYDAYATVDTYFGEKLSFFSNLGMNLRRNSVDVIRASTVGGLNTPGLYSISNSVSQVIPGESLFKTANNGFFGRASFGYDDYVYLDLTGRTDISSTLPVGDNVYFYPSASLSFIPTEFFESETLTFAKVRFNYAEVGSDAPALSLQTPYVINSPFGGNALSSVDATLNNPNLLPEDTKSYEAGIELEFLSGRINFDGSVYKASTTDQILPVTTTAASGQTSKFVNAGEIENKGVELSLGVVPIKTENFQWGVNANWYKNTSKVISLFGEQNNLQLASLQGGVSINAAVGQPFGEIRGTNYSYHTDGSIIYREFRGGLRYANTPNAETIGNYQADWKGGVQNTLKYKNFGLNFLVDIQKGGDFFSLDNWYGFGSGLYDVTAGNNELGNPVRSDPATGGGINPNGGVIQSGTDSEGRFISDGTSVGDKRLYARDAFSYNGYVVAPNAVHIYDASFVKLREVAMNYTLPSKFFNSNFLTGANISLTGKNLWIIHKNSPYSDPEANLSAGSVQGYQSGAYPAVRELGLNFKLNF